MADRILQEDGFGILLEDGFSLLKESIEAVITGTIMPTATEDEIRAGGKTIIITLTGGFWVAEGTAFDAIRQDIIDGLESAQSEEFGWNNVVRGTD